MEIKKPLNDDSDVRAAVDAQGPWFDNGKRSYS